MLAVLGVAVGITIAASALLPARWTAYVSVLVDAKGPDPASSLVLPAQALSGLMATQVDVIRSRAVALKVVDNLKFDQNQIAQREWRESTKGRGSFKVWLAELLLKRLDVKPANESSVIFIGFTGNDPQSAADVANAFAQAYIETNRELKVELARQTAQWRSDRADSQSQAATYTSIAVLSPAVEPIEPSFPKWSYNIALALAFGSALGLAVALVMEVLDQRVRSEADFARTLELPLLATLPYARFPRTVHTRLLTHQPDSASTS